MKIMKNTITKTVLIAYLISPWTQNDYHRKKIIKVKLSNTKYAVNFPVTIITTTIQHRYLTQALLSPVCLSMF